MKATNNENAEAAMAQLVQSAVAVYRDSVGSGIPAKIAEPAILGMAMGALADQFRAAIAPMAKAGGVRDGSQ
jgi:hypothetical protein